MKIAMKSYVPNGAVAVQERIEHARRFYSFWEEMCRTLRFLEWRGEWWMERRSTRNVGATLLEALAAYALKQSDLQRKLAVKFRDTWSTALKDTPIDELDHEDDIDEDADDEDVGIWDEEDEQELDEEDFADL